MTGDITPEIGNMTNLKYLFLGENKFDEGPIPESFGKLTMLEELSLKSANRSGPIPDYFGNFSNLMLLDLDNDLFDETLPKSLGKATNLEFLLLNRNKNLVGEVPDSFKQLIKLRTLLLDRTSLSGSLDGLCELSTFKEPMGDADGTEVLTADCGGTEPEITCDCCTTCCDDADEKSCHTAVDVSSLSPKWEYVFDRYEFDFGSNETYFEDRSYIGENGP